MIYYWNVIKSHLTMHSVYIDILIDWWLANQSINQYSEYMLNGIWFQQYLNSVNKNNGSHDRLYYIYPIFSEYSTNTTDHPDIIEYCWKWSIYLTVMYMIGGTRWHKSYLTWRQKCYGYVVSCHFGQYFSYIGVVSLIGGSTRRKPPTYNKAMPNFIT